MNILELSRPKIGKRVATAALDYFEGRDGILFKEKLAKLGWTPLGNGNFSSVFENPKKQYVLKVSEKPDPAYNEYVKLIKRARNKHFPRISDMKKLLSLPTETYFSMTLNKFVHRPTKEYYVYLIERLEPVRSIDRISLQDVARSCYLVANNWWEPNLVEIFQEEYREFPKFLRRSPSLVQALRFVGEHCDDIKGAWLDIHRDNIMQREDGTIVITDPYAGM